MVEGQKVTWTEVKRGKGGSVTLSAREGKVVKDGDPLVSVKYRGKEMTILRTRLRTADQPNELTEFMKGAATQQ